MNDRTEDIKNYAGFLSKLSGKELAFIASLSGFFLSEGLNAEELNSIGNFLEAVGQILLCMGSQEQYLESIDQRRSN